MNQSSLRARDTGLLHDLAPTDDLRRSRCSAQRCDPAGRNPRQEALIDYAEQNGLAYEHERTPAFAQRQRLLSPEQYEIAEVRTSRGVSRRVILFSKAIIQAEWEANARFREAMAIKRERLRALRANRPTGLPSSAYLSRREACHGRCGNKCLASRISPKVRIYSGHSLRHLCVMGTWAHPRACFTAEWKGADDASYHPFRLP